jgi:pyruvate formate lyase activating enzyme
MLLAGFQKLTLIDFPGHIATTVFTIGCSFRCPFCHNPELVLSSRGYVTSGNVEEEFFDFLELRKGKLEGVCITGGEPTIQPDIIEFMKRIRGAGYAVKLDTNGTRPDVVKKAIDQKLVDYIAMDIKNQPKRYAETAGTEVDLERIKLSADLIMNSRVKYEFRTTVVPGIHTEKDFIGIARWISGARSYWLQRYQEKKILDDNLKLKTKDKYLDLEKIERSIKKHFGQTGIR